MAQISSYLLLTGKLLHNRLTNLWNPKINYISSQIALTNRCNASCPINAVNIWIIFIWWIYRKTSKTDSELIFFWIFFNKFQVKYKKSHFFSQCGNLKCGFTEDGVQKSATTGRGQNQIGAGSWASQPCSRQWVNPLSRYSKGAANHLHDSDVSNVMRWAGQHCWNTN